MKKVAVSTGVFLFLLICVTVTPALIYLGIKKSIIFAFLFSVIAGLLFNRRFHIVNDLANKIDKTERHLTAKEKSLIPNDKTIKIMTNILIALALLTAIYFTVILG